MPEALPISYGACIPSISRSDLRGLLMVYAILNVGFVTTLPLPPDSASTPDATVPIGSDKFAPNAGSLIAQLLAPIGSTAAVTRDIGSVAALIPVRTKKAGACCRFRNQDDLYLPDGPSSILFCTS